MVRFAAQAQDTNVKEQRKSLCNKIKRCMINYIYHFHGYKVRLSEQILPCGKEQS